MIVWITGRTTAGKTWLGDFLQHYHGWVHVEGDKVLHTRKDSTISKDLYVAFLEYWLKLKPAPFELWSEYYKDLCNQVVQIVNGKKESNIVVTFSTYPRLVRDFLREQIKESTGQDLIFILLDVSEEEYLKRSAIRLQDFVKTSGSTMEEFWEKNENMKKLGEYSERKLKQYFLNAGLIQGMEPIEEDEAKSFTINANDNHVHVVPEISRILNLPMVENTDVELVKDMTIKRWKQYNKIMEEDRNKKLNSELGDTSIE